MKKAQRKIRNFVLIFSMCLFLFNFCGCGIDNITVVDPPLSVKHLPVYTNAFDESYFLFETNEHPYTDISFLGTEVYYKIYSNYSDAENDKKHLYELSTNPALVANSASTMIDTYGYKALKVTNQVDSILIPYPKKSEIVRSQIIYIRLTDYKDISAFSARILIGGDSGTNLTGTSEINIPIRNIDGSELSFNFGRNSQNSSINKIPNKDDQDVKYASNVSDGKWYVMLYAVSVGQDVTCIPVYSDILYLGAVTIDSNSFDN